MTAGVARERWSRREVVVTVIGFLGSSTILTVTGFAVAMLAKQRAVEAPA
jgi:hypothetical protein